MAIGLRFSSSMNADSASLCTTASVFLLAQFFCEKVANANADGCIGEKISGKKVVDRDHDFLGIQGMNGLVRRW
jgi:hypothetical protein